MSNSRWKSPVAWAALAALVFFVVKNWLCIEIPGWDDFVTLIISAATAFGIFNNPTTRSNF